MNTQKNKGDILAERIEQILNNKFMLHTKESAIIEALAKYRKPWTLGRSVNGFTLADGQEWHREDFTEDMLPVGWRPCILGETGSDMQSLPDRGIGWVSATWHGLHGCGVDFNAFHHRTRRPLPEVAKKPFLTPEQIADGWLEWHGGEFPVWGGSFVKVMLRNGRQEENTAAHFRYDGPSMWSHHLGILHSCDIIAYLPDPYEALKKAHAEGKVIECYEVGEWDEDRNPHWEYSPERYRVKPEPVMVPLGPEDVPPGSVVRYCNHDSDIGNRWLLVTAVSVNGICVMASDGGGRIDYETMKEKLEISRDGGKTWERCEKEGK